MAKLDAERAAHKATQEKSVQGEKHVKQLQDQLASEGRDKAALQKQLEPSAGAACTFCPTGPSKSSAAPIKQLEAEQKLRQSLQKTVSTKEELRLKAEEEIERLNQDIQEMDEIDRLKTFEPPEKTDEEDQRQAVFGGRHPVLGGGPGCVVRAHHRRGEGVHRDVRDSVRGPGQPPHHLRQ